MRTLFNDGSTVPTAFVTRGRQRVKQYNNDTVYLNNGDEFQIELFNPTTNKVLAKIELNGVSLGAGIVLRPGERVFLERYLNEARKFLFETYEVDGNNPTVRKAIENNGKVSVMFYCEQTYYGSINLSGGSYTWDLTTWPPYVNPIFTTTCTSKGMDSNNASFTSQVDANCFYSNSGDASLGFAGAPSAGAPSAGSLQASLENTRSFSKKSMETGRVEKGSNSNQSFMYDNSSFNTWWTWKSEWKILPFSQKPLVREDMRVFCTNCGARRKKDSHKFCSNCGTKF